MVCQGLISSQNANSFPYFSKASKDLLLFVIVWALFQAFYCGFIIFYESRMYNRVAHITLEHIYNTGDTILFSMVVMAISVTQHPYFALSLNNLSTEACHGIYDGTPHALNLTTNVTARMWKTQRKGVDDVSELYHYEGVWMQSVLGTMSQFAILF